VKVPGFGGGDGINSAIGAHVEMDRVLIERAGEYGVYVVDNSRQNSSISARDLVIKDVAPITTTPSGSRSKPRR